MFAQTPMWWPGEKSSEPGSSQKMTDDVLNVTRD